MSKKVEISPNFPKTYVSLTSLFNDNTEEYPNGLYITRENSTTSANMTLGNEAANFLAESFAESSAIVELTLGGIQVNLIFDVSEVSIALIICLKRGKPVKVTFFSAIPL